MKTGSAHAADDVVSDLQKYRPLFPFVTVKSVGRPLYRSKDARDYACLLDLDPAVVAWQSMIFPLPDIGEVAADYYVDFEVRTPTEVFYVEVGRRQDGVPPWFPRALTGLRYRYQFVNIQDLDPVRLANARDLVRYARYEAALGDRIRVLAALDEMGSLTLAECLSAVREGRPMDTIASMILQRHLEVDIDENLLGPGTVVRLGSK